MPNGVVCDNFAKWKMRLGRSNVAKNRLAKKVYNPNCVPVGVPANNKLTCGKLCENSGISSWHCASKKISSGVWPDKVCENG